MLAHGDQIRLGQAGDTEIVFFVDDEAPSVERSAVSAASELRQMAALLEGLRALGSGRVLDEVLAMVLDSAIEVTGAERGFIMLANREQAARVQARARARQGHAVGPHVRDQPQDSRERCSRPASRRSSRTCSTATSRSCTPAPSRSASATCSARRCAWCATSSAPIRRAPTRSSACCISTAASAARCGRPTRSRRSTRCRPKRRSRSRTRGCTAKRSTRRSSSRSCKVAAAIQQSLLPVANREGAFFSTAAASIACRAVGGDFYDYVDLPTGQFGFIIGDVAGKGSPAALLAAAVLGMFSAEATYQTGAAPLMTRLNHGLFRRAIEARFLTSFYGMLAPDGSLTYCNAGHNAPLLVSASGIRRLETGGVVLGLFEHGVVRRGNADAASPAI